MISRKKIAVATIGALLGCASAAADPSIEEVPTNWKLENYLQNGVVIWNTSANCPQGRLNLNGFSNDDINRLWSLVVTAKVTGRKVGIYYNASNCNIVSFFIQAG